MRTNESDSCNDRYMRLVLCSMASASAAPNVPEDMDMAIVGESIIFRQVSQRDTITYIIAIDG